MNPQRAAHARRTNRNADCQTYEKKRMNQATTEGKGRGDGQGMKTMPANSQPAPVIALGRALHIRP
jgi:hypothetical protein